MITLIISVVCFILLIGLMYAAPPQVNKTMSMTAVVMILLLVTVVDELSFQKKPVTNSNKHKQSQKRKELSYSGELYKGTQNKALIRQQKDLLDYLTNKNSVKQNLLLLIPRIDSSRFRAIFQQFQKQSHSPAILIDFNLQSYTYSQIDQEIRIKHKSQDLLYCIVSGLASYPQVSSIQSLFMNNNVSIIFQKFPLNLLQLSTLGKWTHRYSFTGSYQSEVVQQYSIEQVQLCSQYRTIDYAFYVTLQYESLKETCSKFPSNEVTECLNPYLTQLNDRISYSSVSKCFYGKNVDINGVIYDNGQIGLTKDYFYYGRLSKDVFSKLNEASRRKRDQL